jgi:ribonuclease PH
MSWLVMGTKIMTGLNCIFDFYLQHKFPKAQVNIYVEVLQNDGSGES